MATRILLILGLFLAGLGTATAAQVYQGRVVDAETKEPLQGAVVTVIWMKHPFGDAEGVKGFHAARETLTDADGRFSVDAIPPHNWNPFRPLERHPNIIVFKPGYGRYPDMNWTIDWPGEKPPILESLRSGQAVVIGLPRLKTRHDQELFADPDLHPNVPYERVPIYLRLINEHAVSLGLPPWSLSKTPRPQSKDK